MSIVIENVRQLQDAVIQVGGLIQQITDFTNKHPRYDKLARVRFPRGFIKPAIDIRANLRFIEDENLRRNVSYALMTHEVFRWIVFYTDLGGQAQEMMIKEAVCLLGNICDCATVFPEEYGLGRGSSFKKRIARLQAMHVIDDECAEGLLWLWEKRNQEHLHDVPFREWNHYRIDDWYKSAKFYKSLRDSLNAWRGTLPK